MGALLSSGWSVDAIYRARSAQPLEVWSSAVNFAKVWRPSVVPGVPLYLDDPSAPGGRRINRAAFTTPVNNVHGDFERNGARGFALSQLDMAVRRRIGLGATRAVEVRLEIFNVLNRANFGPPMYDLANVRFGEATQTLGRSLGNLNSLFQVGGPRSIQIGLKASF
jgi:hypothetical protein